MELCNLGGLYKYTYFKDKVTEAYRCDHYLK